ncbi:MAG: phosphoribosylglycinamide formyltransferase [Thermoplasmatota archaeon]
MTLKVAVLASGSGSNLKSLLEKCDSGIVDAHVRLVVTDRPRAGCLQHARDHGVPAILELPRQDGEAREDYDGRLEEVLEAEGPDLIVLAGFMRILTPAFCEAFAGGIINIHPALLPSFKGAHGIRDTLAAGAPLAGCTTHLVTADLDGGPLLLQAALAVAPDDDEASLAARVLRMEHQILPRTVQLFAEGRVTVEDGKAMIAPGASWKDDERIETVPGALYSDGF